MTISFTKEASSIWRDYNTDGVSASGKYSPQKADIRTWGTEVQNFLKGTTALDNLQLTGGTIAGMTVNSLAAALGVAYGGTGAGTAAGARTNLDVPQNHVNLTALVGLAGAADKLGYFTGAGAMTLADLSSFARTLLDDADAAAAMTTLGLSANAQTFVTAANYAAMRTALNVSLKQSNKIDTTAASGLIVGAFGLGDIAYEITDWNALTVSGFYKSTATTANGPDTASWQGIHIGVGTTASNEYAVQMVFKLSAEEIWTRRRQAGTWSSWVNITPIGVGQTWQDVKASRLANTSYQNTTGRPIQVSVYIDGSGYNFQVSEDNSTWLTVMNFLYYGRCYAIIPPNYYYKLNGTAGIWLEFR